MKRVLRVMPLVMLALIACTKQEPVGDINPSNFRIMASTNGEKVLLIWASPLDEIDGYILYFNQKLVDTIPPTLSSYLHDPKGEVGTYTLYAYKGSQTSKPLTASTAPVIYRDTVEVFELNLNITDSLKNAAFGFDDTFRLVPYSIINRTIRSLINFYCTDYKVDTVPYYLAPIEFIVKDTGRTDTTLIPSSGWATGNKISLWTSPTTGIIPEPDSGLATVNPGEIYSVKIKKGGNFYYGTLKIGAVDPNKITIVETKFQKIPGLRVIGK